MEKKPLLTDAQIRKFMELSGWDKLEMEELNDAVSDELDKLVKAVKVERLIGEDGSFYYRSISNDDG